jgi:uncharacterized protein (TIGR00730 family)
MQTRSICVLCGSREGFDPAYREAAALLGRLIVRHGKRLVYGGGSVGLMGVVADAVLDAGGEVVGVIPDFLMRHEVGHCRLTHLVVTKSMHDRKRRMFEMADAFCVLPGGLGTLDESFELITWKQIRLHAAPVVVLDIDGYWEPLQQLIEHVVGAGFAAPSVASLYHRVPSVEAVFELLDRLSGEEHWHTARSVAENA